MDEENIIKTLNREIKKYQDFIDTYSNNLSSSEELKAKWRGKIEAYKYVLFMIYFDMPPCVEIQHSEILEKIKVVN